jgi:hypothetical protein
MIQVCSVCGTRWNVRDRRRVWCPRCNGTLLAPSAPAGAEWSSRSAAMPASTPSPAGGPLPPGYRWIAVRPGAAPPRRRHRRHLGPTPRYAVIPRWGLIDHFDTFAQQQAAPRTGPSIPMVRNTMIATIAVLGFAALLHVVRYALLIVNRTVLLNSWLAGAVTWLGVAVSVVAMFTVFGAIVVLTNWLIARRAAAFAHRGHEDPRPVWALRVGCLTPVANLAWAPVFVIELAGVEDRLSRLQRPIVAWWLVWVASTVVSIFSIATSFASDAQGIANNTVTTTIAYLVAMAAFLLAMKVFLGFERQPVSRPVRRWVIVPDDHPAAENQPEPELQTAAAVESEGQNPAA